MQAHQGFDPPDRDKVFLECLDSIASTSPLDDLRVFLELVAAFSMGRDAVVSQSQAFDSLGFQRAAVRVWKAARASRVSSPIHLHLHGAGSFDEAVSNMLHPRNGTFYSSAYPELRDARVRATIRNAQDLTACLAGSARAKWLSEVRTQFKDVRPGRPSRQLLLGDGTPLSLGGIAREAIRSPRIDPSTRDMLQRADGHLRFNAVNLRDRSLLREDVPWPGSRESARELLSGDPGLWEVTTEFVDTIYNRVVGHSTWARFQRYNTGTWAGSLNETLIEAGKAEDAAVEVTGGQDVDTGVALEVTLERRRRVPAKLPAEAKVEPQLHVLNDFLDAETNWDLLVQGLAGLLRARNEPLFVDRVRRIRIATSPERRRELLAEHLGEVTRHLGNPFGTRAHALTVTFGEALTGGLVRAVDPQRAGAGNPAWDLVVEVSTAFIDPLLKHLPELAHGSHHHEKRALATALGHVLEETA